MNARALRERLNHEPFEPFRVISSSGRAVTVSNPDLVVLTKSEVFIAEPNSDRWTQTPYLHIAALESGGPPKGRGGRRRRAG